MSRISRRKFVVHSAHTTIGVSAGAAAFQAADPAVDSARAGAVQTPLKLCLVSGAPHYESDESLWKFGNYLQQHFNVKCGKAYRTSANNLTGLERLAQSDCMLLFAQRMAIDGEQLDCIKRYCNRGGPVVALRSAGCALTNWPALDTTVFGGVCLGQHVSDKTAQVSIARLAARHPVLDRVEPFRAGGPLSKIPRIARDAKCLLAATMAGCREPVAWTRTHRTGRIFYSTLGHPADFRSQSFVRLLTNAVFWVARRDKP